jgi:nucleotide-binding universal stress UspA family protein
MAEAIINVAETRGADLIIVGASGLSSPEGLLLGSVSQKVMHHATCPVLLCVVTTKASTAVAISGFRSD